MHFGLHLGPSVVFCSCGSVFCPQQQKQQKNAALEDVGVFRQEIQENGAPV
jgi:hypothetical protein